MAKIKRKCVVFGCEHACVAKGHCKRHYMQMQKHGQIVRKKIFKKCGIKGCERSFHAKDRCYKHYVTELEFINKIVNTKFKGL